MTEIEKQILINQSVIMDALWENMHLSKITKRELDINRRNTLKLIKREQEKQEGEKHGN